MHILLGILGLLIGLYVLYRFFISANPQQIITFAVFATTGIACLFVVLLALMGRLPIALALVALLWPAGVGIWKWRRKKIKLLLEDHSNKD